MDCTLYSVMLSWMSLCFSISNMLDLHNSVFENALGPSIVQHHSSSSEECRDFKIRERCHGIRQSRDFVCV